MTGEAEFAPDGETGLRYTESGILRFGTYEDQVSRTYLYRFSEPHLAVVSFEDGRPFHTFDSRYPDTAIEHLCGDDLYAGSIVLEGEQTWSARWRVTGPRKDLNLSSHYSRAQP